MSYQPKQLTGNEIISCTENEVDGATVLDFWQWAFSNLCTNDVRCTYAEWMVHWLLGIQRPRDSWAAYDLKTEEGVRIEVKSSAYIQSWEQKSLSPIRFGGLKSKAESKRENDPATYNADLYVFCVQIETDTSKWNALDINQWRFYILTREQMVSIGYKSMGLETVAGLCKPMTAAEFARRASCMIRKFGQTVSLPKTSHHEHQLQLWPEPC